MRTSNYRDIRIWSTETANGYDTYRVWGRRCEPTGRRSARCGEQRRRSHSQWPRTRSERSTTSATSWRRRSDARGRSARPDRNSYRASRRRTSKTVYHSVPPAGKTKQKHHEPEQPSNLNDHIRFALRDSERPQHDNIHTRPPPLFPQTITLWWMPPPRSHGGMDCSFSRSQAGARAAA